MANASTHPQQPRRSAPRKFADGGPVRGPGTGTSDEVADEVPSGTYIMPADSTQAVGEQQLAVMGARGFDPGRDKVPVQLSNGEYKLPPEQVHAIGVQALDQMKSATHTPGGARGFSPGAPGAAQEPEPRLFFAEGGVAFDEQRRRQQSPDNIYPQSSPAAGANIYNGAGFSADQFGSSGQFAKVPDSIGQQPGRAPAAAASPAPAAAPQGMTDAQRAEAIGQIPTGGVAAPPVAGSAAPAAPRAPAPAASRPMDAQAVSDRAKIGAAWDTLKDVNDDAGRAIADVAMLVPRGLAGAYDSAVVRPMRAAGLNAGYLSPSLVPAGVDPASMTPYTDQKRMQQPPAAAAPAAPAPQASLAATSTAPAPATAPAAARPASHEYGPPNLSALAQPAPAAAATEVMPGVFRSGNSYSDSSASAIASASPRGLPSARDMAAADALADRSQAESLARVTAARGFTPGFTGVIGQTTGNGNIWSRTPEQQQRDAAVSASSISNPEQMRGFMAARQMADMARAQIAQGNNQTTLAQTQMQGEAQRDVAALREQGDTSRANTRNDIEVGRLALDQQVRGFDIRNGQRQESLVRRYEAAKTPAEKASIAQQIRDLSGKTSNPREDLMVVGGGQEWDSKANVMRNVPQRVFDAHTRQFVDGGGAAAAAPAKDSPEVLAIKNNTALSLEQRREELRKLGFQ